MKVLIAALMVQGAVAADWASDLMCGRFWVAGEALLLRPSGQYPYETIVGPTVQLNGANIPNGSQATCCPSYEWGYKIEVGYRNCDRELLVNWASFNNGYSKKFQARNGDLLWNTLGLPGLPDAVSVVDGSLRARNTFKYDVLDGEMARYKGEECSKFCLRMFLGVRYFRVENNRGQQIFNSDGDLIVATVNQSDVQGTGPRVGFGGRYELCWGLGLTGSMSGHLLIGSAKSRFSSETAVQDGSGAIIDFAQTVGNHTACRIIPASEIKFGIDWRPCLFCGLDGILEVGYQISHYFYGSQGTFFTASTSGANRVRTEPVSFDGWYFRLGLMY